MADISHTLGDTFVRALTFVDSDDAALDITGAAIALIIKEDPADDDSEALLNYDTAGGEVTITDADAGLAEVVGPADDWTESRVSIGQRLFYRVVLTDADDKVYTTEEGTITITA